MEKKAIKVNKIQLNTIFIIERDNYDKTRFYGTTLFNYNNYNNFINQKGLLRLHQYNNMYMLSLIGADYNLTTHSIITKEAIEYIQLIIRKNKIKKLMNG